MFPTILKLGPVTIRTYGLLVALGLFAGLKYVLHYARKGNISENQVLDLLLCAIVSGLAGARLTYVLFNWQFYWQHPADIVRIWEGGLVFYGGFAAGALAIIIYARFHPAIRLSFLADIIAPALALGHFFGRLGCFSAGCCYGIPCNLPWAVKFTNPGSLAPLNIPLHPAQLYEAIGNIVIFFALHNYNKRKHVAGNVFLAYLIAYGIMRFALEFLRGDDRGTFLLGISPGQVISLLLIAVSIAILAFRRKKDYDATTAVQ